MRILHTSDWHLGRSFHREGMLGHQAAYVDHLLSVVEQGSVDVVCVSGDVYDRALPQVDAVRLASEALSRLAASRAKVVITSGNHDSAQRLGFGSELIDAAGIFIRTDLAGVGRPVMLPDEHGKVAFYGLPYLDPDAAKASWRLESRSHQAALGEAMRRVRADLDGRGGRSVVMAHAFVTGAEPSDSERDISVGGVSMVPASLFEDISYAALGHLHGRHTITETVRYSGSPLAYSFSEANHLKGSWLIDLDESGFVASEFVEAPVPRKLARLRGTLDELLSDPRHEAHEQSWVQITLTDRIRPAQAMERLRRRFPHTLVLGFESTAPVLGALSRPDPSRPRRDIDLVTEFVAELRGEPAAKAELALLQTAVDACCEDPEVDTLDSRAGDAEEEEWLEVLF
ncbi:exonuclease SbcCD subunit D [Nocardioides sp.]|uniref:exonuclease SbcCD subunit D n=1 Tax=Nocardioides sp. TaxID=35761 RepID=UPI0019A45F3D|nr:exonuclease SbcCD subunit D [Nocardioides sp.]MBC7279683.1 exonuclease SbcCD subunit D [Nocardioides sp.]